MENVWKAAARHWWERMRQAELARDRWVEAAHRVGAENRLVFEERDELLQKLEELRAQPSGIPGDFAEVAMRWSRAALERDGVEWTRTVDEDGNQVRGFK